MSEYLESGEPGRDHQGPLRFLMIVVCLGMTGLLTRAWYLQVLKGDEFRNFADNNRLKQLTNRAPRGIIYDRHGAVLVDNTIDFDVTVSYQFLRDPQVRDNTITNLQKMLSLSEKDVADLKERVNSGRNFEPVLVKKQISRDELAVIETRRDELPGVDISIESKRTYNHQSVGSHVYGYIGEVSRNEMEKLNKRPGNRRYKMADYIGKAGIERGWEEYLRGEDGTIFVEVDALGRRLEGRLERSSLFPKIPPKPPVPGNNLHLTIDADLQMAAYDGLKNGNGAVVALDPKNGQVLAMISKPGFDPTLFSRGIEPKTYAELINNPLRPFRNKVIQDIFPPGSTFKTISAIAGLETGLIDANTTAHCRGTYQFGGKTFHCWKKGGHGTVRLYEALQQSCNVFFYQLASRIDIDTVWKYGNMLGLGKPTGIQLDREARGLLPNEKWNRDTYKQPWFPGETLSAIIGQGKVSMTPIQLALSHAALSNGGALYAPYLVDRVEDPYGNILFTSEPRLVHGTALKPETVTAIITALTAVVEEPGGSAHRIKTPKARIAGKTGTAQVIALGKDKIYRQCEMLDYFQRQHGWFVAMSPPENAEIVVAVFAEHGCSGAGAAAPVAKAVIEAYFDKKLAPRPQAMTISPVTAEAVQALQYSYDNSHQIAGNRQ